MAIEGIFYALNVKSALKLGQVRGVAMLAAANCGMPVVEYAPLSIKSAVVGYGLAAKAAKYQRTATSSPSPISSRRDALRPKPAKTVLTSPTPSIHSTG